MVKSMISPDPTLHVLTVMTAREVSDANLRNNWQDSSARVDARVNAWRFE